MIEKLDLEFCKKDIPLPEDNEVRRELVRRTYDFIVRLRWRILAHLFPEKFKKDGSKTYGYRSPKFPTSVKTLALERFEKDLWLLIRNV